MRGELLPVVGRQREILELARALSQLRKRSALLLGDPGVGKTAIVAGLAQWAAGPDSPPWLQALRVVELSMTSLVAGTSLRGQFEERIETIIEEAIASDTTIFIDEFHTVIGAGGEGASDASNCFKPAPARGDLRLIGATTPAEYRRHVERDDALRRRLEPVYVPEPTREEAFWMLKGVRERLEQHHQAAITDEALENAITLSVRHLPEQRLPDKALDVLDQTCARIRLSGGEAGVAITAAAVASAVSERCGISLARMSRRMRPMPTCTASSAHPWSDATLPIDRVCADLRRLDQLQSASACLPPTGRFFPTAALSHCRRCREIFLRRAFGAPCSIFRRKKTRRYRKNCAAACSFGATGFLGVQ